MGLLPLEFTDGLTDSPYFRETLQAHERELDRTNSAIKHLMKDIRDLVVAAKTLSRAQRTLSDTLNNFNFECIGTSQTDDEMVIANSFKDFARLLSTIEDERDRLLEKADEAFLEPIERFRREQIGSAKEAKKKFDKETNKYCQNLERYLNMSINKKSDNQLLEADANYSIEQWHFFKAMSEYVLKLQEVNERKKFEFVETVLSFMLGWLTFYHQGHEIATDFYSVKMELQMRLQRTRNNFNMTQEETKCLRQKMLNNNDKKLRFQDSGSFNKMYTRQGYLFLMEKKAFTTSWTKHFCQYEKGNRRLTMIQYTQTMGKILSTEEIIVKECIRRNTDSIDRRFCFDVVTESSGQISTPNGGSASYSSNASTGSNDAVTVYTFQALSEEDYKHWVDALDGRDPIVITNAKNSKPNSSKSVDSGKASTDSGYSDSYDLDEEGYYFVRKCIQSIEAKGLDQKGIYRIVGVTSKVRNLMDMFIDKRNQSIARRKSSTSDSNSSTDESGSELFELNLDSEEFETKTITSALKSYLRNLAEPIMTFQLHQAFISAAKLENRSLRIDRIHTLVHRLPELNFKVLKCLIEHLQKVSKLHEKNLMTPSNLGVCFGPTLLRTAEESVAAILDIKFVNVIAELLIEHYEKIFLTKPVQEDVSPTSSSNSFKTSAKGHPEFSIQQRPLPNVPMNQQVPYHGVSPMGAKTANQIFFAQPQQYRFGNNLMPVSAVRSMSSQLTTDGTYGQRQLRLAPPQGVRRSSSQDQLYQVIPAIQRNQRIFVSPQQQQQQNMPQLSHLQHRHLGYSTFPHQQQQGSPQLVNLSPTSPSPSSSTMSSPAVFLQQGPAHIYQTPMLLKNAPVTSTSSSGIYGQIGRAPPQLLQPSVSYQNLHYNAEIAAATQDMSMQNHPSLAPYTRPMTSIGILPLATAMSGRSLEQQNKVQPSQSLNLSASSRPTSNPSSTLQPPRQLHLSSTSSASLPSTPEHSQQPSQFPYANRAVANIQGLPVKPSLHSPSVVDSPFNGYEPVYSPQTQSQLYGTIGHQAHRPIVTQQPQPQQSPPILSTKVRTRYVCIGGSDSELSFQPNMIITNVRASREPGWLEGNLNGKTGLIPLNYVEFIE